MPRKKSRSKAITTPQVAVPELGALQDLASRFRSLINEPRRHHAIFQRQRDFNFICSAMDIIDDILFALRSYTTQHHDDQGLAYLEIFGVLQALFVQQDAVRQLYRIVTGGAINLETEYPDIKAIRDVRVRVAGHPVGGAGGSHFIVRYTVSKWGFELWKYDQTGGRTTEEVNLPGLIKKTLDRIKYDNEQSHHLYGNGRSQSQGEVYGRLAGKNF
jgi:hypothetical protein